MGKQKSMRELHPNTEWKWPKHQGKSVFNVIDEDPTHVIWMIENVFPKAGCVLSGTSMNMLRQKLDSMKDNLPQVPTSIKTVEELTAQLPQTPVSKVIHRPIKGRIIVITANQIEYVKSTEKLSGKAHSNPRRQEKQRA